MSRTTKHAMRVAAAAVSIIIGCVIALARMLMGHEAFTALAVACVACWAILPSREDTDALRAAVKADKGQE